MDEPVVRARRKTQTERSTIPKTPQEATGSPRAPQEAPGNHRKPQQWMNLFGEPKGKPKPSAQRFWQLDNIEFYNLGVNLGASAALNPKMG